MKKILGLILSTFIVLSSLYAQVPSGIKYQAVARDASGAILPNQSVNIRLSILSGPGGNPAYVEAHKVGTNDFGLFSVDLGRGVPLTGDFDLVPWANANMWLKVEFDPQGGSNYTPMGESELLTVPYAMYAKGVDVSLLGDTSQTNETITDVIFDPTTNELTVTESGTFHVTTIDFRADDLSDNTLSELGDVNLAAAPATDQILRWNGIEWIASDDETNDQTIAIINNVLNISDGNSVDLSPYLDNTDAQVLGYDAVTNTLTLSNGGAIDLTDLSVDAYNQGISYNPTNDELTIVDGGGNIIVDLTPLRDDADADPMNENNQSFNFNPSNNELTITDAGASLTVDLTQLSAAAFNTGLGFNPTTGELTVTDGGTSYTVDLTQLTTGGFNTGMTFDNGTNTLTIVDNGSSINVNLADLIDDADADPTNEYNSGVLFDPSTNVLTITDGGGAIPVNLNDLVTDAYNTNASFDPLNNSLTITDAGSSLVVNLDDLVTDAYNTNFTFNTATSELTIVDGGAPFVVDLSDLIDDADADPTNEIQALNYDQNSGVLSLSGSGATVNLSSLTGTDEQDLSANQVGSSVTIDITNGNSATFGIDDADADPVNELQDVSLNGNTLGLSNSAATIDLTPYLDDTDEQNLSTFPTGTDVTVNITNGAGVTFSVADNDNDATNELVTNFNLNGSDLELTDASGTKTVSLASLSDADGDPTNELITSFALNGTDLEITDASGTKSVSLSSLADNDADPTNELLNSATLNGTDLELTDAGGTTTVSLASLSDADADPTNELQDLDLAGNTLSLTSDATPVDLTAYLDNTDAQDLALTGNTLSLTNDASTVDLSGYLDNTDNQDLSLTGNILSLTNDGTSVDLSAFLDNTDNQDLGNTVSGTDVTVSITGGTSTTFSVADNDNSASNELQTLSQSGTTVSLSSGGGSVTVDPSVTNELQTISQSGTTVTLSNSGGSVTVDPSVTNELQDLTYSGNTLGIVGGNSVTLNTINNLAGTPTYTMYYNGSAWVQSGTIRNNGTNAAIGGAVDNNFKLRIYGKVRSNGVNETSDARFKENVITIDDALKMVMEMRGVTYDWKLNEFPNKGFEEGEQVGVIAQEIEKVLPQVVEVDEEGYRSVEYSHIVPVLIEAIKQQQALIAELQAQNTASADANVELEERLNNMEKSLSYLIYTLAQENDLEFISGK